MIWEMGLSTVKTLQEVLFLSRPLRGLCEIEWRWVPVRGERARPHTLTFFSPCVPCCITIHAVTYLFCLWPKGNTFEEINRFFSCIAIPKEVSEFDFINLKIVPVIWFSFSSHRSRQQRSQPPLSVCLPAWNRFPCEMLGQVQGHLPHTWHVTVG